MRMQINRYQNGNYVGFIIYCLSHNVIIDSCFLHVIYQIVLIGKSIILNDVHIYLDVVHLIDTLAVLATRLSYIHQKLKYSQL